MVKLVYNYYKDTHQVNIPFSLLIGAIGGLVEKDFWQAFLATFSFSLLTGGLLLSLYLHQLRYKEQYYFYYNRGLSKIHLAVACLVINAGIVVVAKLVKHSLA